MPAVPAVPARLLCPACPRCQAAAPGSCIHLAHTPRRSPPPRAQDLRAFVDAAHAAGLSVIIDVVLHHGAPEGNALWEYDGWGPDNNGGIFHEGAPDTEWGRQLAFWKREVRRRASAAAACGGGWELLGGWLAAAAASGCRTAPAALHPRHHHHSRPALRHLHTPLAPPSPAR